jgi:hypothetical protein
MNNAITGWILAVAFVAAAVHWYGWRGALVAATFVVFWLLLQFNRAVRVLRRAGNAPVGHVENVVALQAKLDAGLNMAEVLALTHSLGERLPGADEAYRWRDPGGDALTLWFRRGRLLRWQLERAVQPWEQGPEALDAADDAAPRGPSAP